MIYLCQLLHQEINMQINLQELGSEYNIVDDKGNIRANIQLLYIDDVNMDVLSDCDDLSSQLLNKMVCETQTMYANRYESPTDILWHSCSAQQIDNIDIPRLVSVCLDYDYSCIVVEIV